MTHFLCYRRLPAVHTLSCIIPTYGIYPNYNRAQLTASKPQHTLCFTVAVWRFPGARYLGQRRQRCSLSSPFTVQPRLHSCESGRHDLVMYRYSREQPEASELSPPKANSTSDGKEQKSMRSCYILSGGHLLCTEKNAFPPQKCTYILVHTAASAPVCAMLMPRRMDDDTPQDQTPSESSYYVTARHTWNGTDYHILELCAKSIVVALGIRTEHRNPERSARGS